MKSYSNKVEGTAALQFGSETNHQTRIIDFEYAQRSRYTSFPRTVRTSSRRAVVQRVKNLSIAAPFIKHGEQRSSLVVVDRKSVALYTTIITAFFIICSLFFV